MSNQPDTVKEHFIKLFDTKPIKVVSPGRVNLIGEHTDYNDGFVLPAAIEKVIIVCAQLNNQDVIRVYSVDKDEKGELDLKNIDNVPDQHWLKFIKGIVKELTNLGYSIKGFDMTFGGNIPIGAGMSSSAALEGGVLLALNKLMDLDLKKIEMAKIGQLTEHRHVGVMCGIMDQFVNLHGKTGHALKLDCRSLDFELYPFHRDDLNIVLVNSKVSHNLADSEYNVRRKQCEEGVNILRKYNPEIRNLRDVSQELLDQHKDELTPLVYQRCKFVLDENERVHHACIDLQNNDFNSFGQRMLESHQGLSELYEVSCKELDILVELAGEIYGVLGSRMMGGGFGGCTINVVEKNEAENFSDEILKLYKERTGIDSEVYITSIGDGAHLVSS